MIFKDRGRAKREDPIGENSAVREEYLRAEKFFRSERVEHLQRAFEFNDEVFKECGVRQGLSDVFGQECAFCSATLTGSGIIHRLRPPQDAMTVSGRVNRELYYWLAFEWRNLFQSCEYCAAAQGTRFPTKGNPASAGTHWDLLPEEDPLLLDPCADNPEAELLYLDSGEVAGVTERGIVTIEVFALNRSALVEARSREIERAREACEGIALHYGREELEECARRLLIGYSTEGPFAAVRRQFVNQFVQARRRQMERALLTVGASLAELSSSMTTVTKKRKEEVARGGEAGFFENRMSEPTRQLTKVPSMQAVLDQRHSDSLKLPWNSLGNSALRRAYIRNFKGIEEAEIEFDGRPGEGTWTVLLGDNGYGKTSVLQAVALALAGEAGYQRVPQKSRDLLRQGATSGEVRMQFEGSREELGFALRQGRSPAFRGDHRMSFAAYGATRLIAAPRHGGRKPKYLSANFENLFDPFVALARPELWLKSIPGKEFDTMGRSLIQLLDLGDDVYLDRGPKGELLLAQEGVSTELSQLSSGYQAVAGMALDLMRVMLERWGSVDLAEGLVLIDEIEAHLHPSWQLKIVESLRAAFPRVQFVVSTHSPLVVKGARSGETLLMSRWRHAQTFERLEVPRGASVDQILTSESFGMSSTIDPKIEADFERYYHLLRQDAEGIEVQNELGDLRRRLDAEKQMGATRREKIMLEAIDKFLSQERGVQATSSHRNRRTVEELDALLSEIWSESLS